MAKSKKKMIILLVCVGLLAALVAVYFGVKAKAAQYEADQSVTYDNLLTLTADDIKTIAYTNSDNSADLSFTRTDGTWALDSDSSFALDQDAVSTLASGVTGVSVYQTLTGVTDLSQYGLDSPVVQATITDTDGNTTTISIGSSNDATSKTYVYLNGDTSTVYVTATSISSNFYKTQDDFKSTDSSTDTSSAAAAADSAAASTAESTADSTAASAAESTSASAADSTASSSAS